MRLGQWTQLEIPQYRHLSFLSCRQLRRLVARGCMVAASGQCGGQRPVASDRWPVGQCTCVDHLHSRPQMFETALTFWRFPGGHLARVCMKSWWRTHASCRFPKLSWSFLAGTLWLRGDHGTLQESFGYFREPRPGSHQEFTTEPPASLTSPGPSICVRIEPQAVKICQNLASSPG